MIDSSSFIKLIEWPLNAINVLCKYTSSSVALVIHVQVQLQMHMEQFFENAKSVQRAIEFTQRFERSVIAISFLAYMYWYVQE